ncbi:LysR substrate-binding domain-containing protein [Pedobacter sp. AW1-32]|uniref:LysR substrate-binding domain-containing protein n=1 Tax=Pedobacter sp. AW1-32 TaxID=3383026 RepID=UPI003FF10028
MELRQLRYFVKAKELLNFTEAANALNISQSTLSQQIAQLELELGIPLFNRVGKRITLTEAGDLFYGHAQESLNRANNGIAMLKELNGLTTGKLLIGVTYGLRDLMTPVLLEFLEQYPSIKVEVLFGTSQQLRGMLLDQQLDILLTFEEIVHDNSLVYTLLFESPLCLISSKSVALDRKEINLTEVMKLPLVLPAKGYSTRQFIDDTLIKSRQQPNISVEINDIPTLLDLVRTGKWFTMLAKTTVGAADDLVCTPIKGKNMARKAMLLSVKDIYVKKAVAAFCEQLLVNAKKLS